jgi:hypothetical protein
MAGRRVLGELSNAAELPSASKPSARKAITSGRLGGAKRIKADAPPVAAEAA